MGETRRFRTFSSRPRNDKIRPHGGRSLGHLRSRKSTFAEPSESPHSSGGFTSLNDFRQIALAEI